MGVVTPGLVCTLASLPSLKVIEFGKGVRGLALSDSVVMSGTGDGRWPSLAWVERIEGASEVVDFLVAHVRPWTCPGSNPSRTRHRIHLLPPRRRRVTHCHRRSPTSPTSPTSSAFASYQQHSAAATLANAAGYGYYKLTPAQQRASAASLAALCKAHGVDTSQGGGVSPIESILTTPNGGVSFAYASRHQLQPAPASALGRGGTDGYEALVTSMLVSLIPGATDDVAPAREIAAAAASGEFAKNHVCTETCKQFLGAGKTVASLPPAAATTTGAGAGAGARRKSGCLGHGECLDSIADIGLMPPGTAAPNSSSSSPAMLATAQIVNAFTAEFLREYSLPADATCVPGAAATKAKATPRVFKRLDVLDVSDVPHARVSRASVADMPLGAHLIAHPRHVSALFTSPTAAMPKITRMTLVPGSPVARVLQIDPRAHLPFLEHLTLGRSPVARAKYDRDACRGIGCQVRAVHDWDFWDLREWELAYAAVEEGSGPFAGVVARKKEQPAAAAALNAFADHAAPLDPTVTRIRLEPGLKAIEWITGLPTLKKLSVLQPLEVLVGRGVAVKLTVANRESSGVWAALAKYVVFVKPRSTASGVAAIHVVPGAKVKAGFAAQGQGAFKSMWMREPGFQHLVDKLAHGVVEENAREGGGASARGPKGARVVPAASHGASAMVVGPAGLWLTRADAHARSNGLRVAAAMTMMPLVRADSGVDHGSPPALSGQVLVRGSKAVGNDQPGAGVAAI
ncbi:hypothetical protein BCR44DRAFT_1428356, partial [Catenaria anguillulae PL171]